MIMRNVRDSVLKLLCVFNLFTVTPSLCYCSLLVVLLHVLLIAVCVFISSLSFPFILFPANRLVFEEPEDPSSRSFFSEIIASISDVKFSHNGRYILSRDYLTVKVC